MFIKPTDHIRYSRQTGFTGIMSNDKEQWNRKYLYIEDFELTVQEAEGWLSKHWNKVLMAEQRPREFLDQWIGCKWLNLNAEGYKEPEIIYNPEQLISFIEQYFNNAELLKIMKRGKRESISDTLAKEHYEKALGHAVKLRKEISDFPQTPEASGIANIDLRHLQEWCIECQKISNDFITRIKLDRLEKGLSVLRELRELLKSGFPPIDQKKWGWINDKVRSDLDKIAMVVEELSESLTTPAKDSKVKFKYNFQHWYHRVIFSQDCEPLLKKLAEYKIHVPNNMEELAEVITAAEWMKKIDWDKVKAIVEERESGKTTNVPWSELSAQASLLGTAQIAEDKINELIFKEYRRENHDFAEAENQVEKRIAELFNEASGVLNSDQNLCKVSFLRDGKLFSDFRRLDDRLFGKQALRSDEDDPLHDIIEELESLRDEVIRCEPSVSTLETEREIEHTKYLEKPTSSWRTTPIYELVTQNEGYNLELKETLEFCVKKSERDRSLIKDSLKAIDAFLNTDGGTLLIGVSDTGVVKGLDRDFKFADKNNKQDGFQLKLRCLINDRFDPSPFKKVEITFEELRGCIVCRINVEASYDQQIALDNEFYIRDGNCTRKLEGSDLVNWTKQRFS